MRIRRRLILYAAAVAAAGMGLFGILLSGLATRGIVQDQDRALGRLAEETAAAVARAEIPPVGRAPAFLMVDLASSTEPFVVVLAADGTALYATGHAGGTTPAIPAAVVVEAIRVGRSAATIGLGPDLEARIQARRWTRRASSGVVIAGQSTKFAAAQIAGFRLFLIFAAVITIIAVVLVSALVIGRALRPLRTLAGTAEEIRRTGDLGRRLPPVRTKDEVGVLTASFNGMLEALQAAQERLSAALAAQRRFVGDASHELRSPLTTIRHNAEFLREHPEAGVADRAEAIADIAAESLRVSRLVDGLLALAWADAEQVPERRPVDLGALAGEVARKLRRPDRAVRIAVNGPVLVRGDAEALARLVGTLLDNALRHGAGDVDLGVQVEDGEVRLTVADRGPGIPDEEIGRIFDRFYRGRTAPAGEGVGLGLAIARSIGESHGGRVRAANRPEGGAIFTVELPSL